MIYKRCQLQTHNKKLVKFYVLLTVHPCIISQINPTSCTILFNISLYFSSLHVSGLHAPTFRRKLLYLCVLVPTSPRQRMVANTVQPVPDVVITVWVCSWWWMRVSSKTCRAVCRNIIKLYIVASCWTVIDIDSRYTDPWT